MARARSIWPAIVALLLLGGGAAWWAASARDENEAASQSTTPAAAPRPRRRAGDAKPPATPAASPAKRDADETDWLERLARLVAEGSKDEDALNALLAEAGRGKPPGGGLHEVLRRASEARARAVEESERRRAEDLVRWTVERALRPYREDRALFAKVYREVRFGDGRVDLSGGSPVRELRFADAAKAVAEIRPRLRTWCYDALALRVVEALARDDGSWTRFRGWCTARKWEAPPAPGSPEARTTTPTELFHRYVLPRLEDAATLRSFDWPQLFLDLGEIDAAADCVARLHVQIDALPADSAKKARAWAEARLDPVEEEIRAIRGLRDARGWRVPDSAAGLEAWFAKARTTAFAHAVGSDGDVELGAWDEAMTKSFLEGGLPWAPEQWQAERARVAEARDDSKDGLSGWSVRSPNWDAFTDVSSEFAGEATLVLESGWKQAQDALGARADHSEPVGARIYKYRDAYESVTHDRSGGHWIGGMNSVLTFLDQPDHSDFRQFRYPMLVHETTHAALSWGVGGGVPSWMHEGLACFMARWSPVASAAWNQQATRGFLRNGRALLAARDAKTLPTFVELIGIRGKWDADEFGPATMARYAAAESLFVWLADDSERWKLVGRWLAAARRGVDPATTITAQQRVELDKGWREFVEARCAEIADRQPR